MANLEHLDILKQGVQVWNEWRKKHLLDIQPDLGYAQFDSDMDERSFKQVNQDDHVYLLIIDRDAVPKVGSCPLLLIQELRAFSAPYGKQIRSWFC